MEKTLTVSVGLKIKYSDGHRSVVDSVSLVNGLIWVNSSSGRSSAYKLTATGLKACCSMDKRIYTKSQWQFERFNFCIEG